MNNVIELNTKTFLATNFSANPIKDFLHDVRSPLQALKALTTDHGLTKEDESDLFDKCMNRIKSLTLVSTKSDSSIYEVCISNLIKNVTNEKQVEKGILISTRSKLSSAWFKLSICELELHNIISNLVNNSFDAGCTKNIRIDVHNTNNKLVINIIDKGTGIDSSTISKIGVYGNTFSKNGSGLALANITKELNNIGASLVCRSIPNIITKFTIEIPTL